MTDSTILKVQATYAAVVCRMKRRRQVNALPQIIGDTAFDSKPRLHPNDISASED